ncbi:hypothetical protein [Agromyces sp. CCNWLW203]|uniref:hypothetical protein n=1 Tax=Agromyces sp. CCNWLW203 TaxID=3112842 RepID=UPI002F9673C1
MTTRTPHRARTGLALAGIGLLLAALTACAPDTADTPELASGDSDAAYEDWSIDFTACMKGEGVDMSMTFADASGSASSGAPSGDVEVHQPDPVDPGEVDLEAMEAAHEKCIDEVGEPPVPPGMPDADEMNEAMLAFAACMREAGYDYPDPEISNDGGVVAMQAMPADDIDPAVMEACNEEAGFPDMQVTESSE